jgi:hypothetical protein
MNKAGSWTRFRKYIYDKGLAIKKGIKIKGEPTHLLLDGGRLVVPEDRNLELLREFAHSYMDGEPLYLIEHKTFPCFNMMAEFDIKFKGERLLSSDEVRAIVAVVQDRVISVAYKDRKPEELRVAVLQVEPKTVEGGRQSGVHLIWKIPVDLDTSWRLRVWMLRELELFFGDRLRPENAGGWMEAFDFCVLDKNGLRLVGSRKAVACPAFKKRDKEDEDESICSACEGSGKLDQGRPYRLAYIADARGNIDEEVTAKVTKDPMATVLACSIRTYVKEPWSLRISAAEAESLTTSVKEERRKQPKEGKTAAVRKRDSAEEYEEIDPESEVFKQIEQVIMAEFPRAPKVTRVKFATKTKDAYFANTSSTFCLNKQGEHGHSTVYFIVTPKGAKQRCFCKKPAVQPGGGVPCSKYASAPSKLPQVVLEALFGPKVLGLERKKERLVKLGNELASTAPLSIESGPMRRRGTFSSHDFVRALQTAKFRLKF